MALQYFISASHNNFSVADTLISGQCFRWSEHNGRLCGTAFGRYVEIEQGNDGITIYAADQADYESVWRQYLDMDRDYDEIRRIVTGIEPRLADSAEFAAGAISEALSEEYELYRDDSFMLERAGRCIYISTSEVKGGGTIPEHLQTVYVIPAGDGCIVATEHCSIESAEGVGRRFAYMMHTLSLIEK